MVQILNCIRADAAENHVEENATAEDDFAAIASSVFRLKNRQTVRHLLQLKTDGIGGAVFEVIKKDVNQSDL